MRAFAPQDQFQYFLFYLTKSVDFTLNLIVVSFIKMLIIEVFLKLGLKVPGKRYFAFEFLIKQK